MDYESAYANFAAAAEVKPDMDSAQFNAGWTAERLGRLQQAAEHYRMALEANPSNQNALFAYASVLTNAGNATEAVGLFKTYMDANPNDNTVRASYTEALLVAKMYDQDSAYQEECKESCHGYGQVQEALRQNSEDLQAYQNLSRMYFEQGNFQMSQLCAEKAQMISKDDPGILNNRGVTFLEMDKPALAIVEFQEAIAINPRLLQPNLNLGCTAQFRRLRWHWNVLTEPSRLHQAIRMQNWAWLLPCGEPRTKTEKTSSKAAKLYEQVIAAEPTNQMAYYNAATLHELYSKDYDQALEYLTTYAAKVHQGIPDTDTQTRIDRVALSKQEAQEAKARAEAERKAAEEREARQRKVLEDLKTQVGVLDGLLAEHGSCAALLDSGLAEMGMMVKEQAQVVIEAEEFEMAAEVLPFLEDSVGSIQGIIPECSGAPPAATGGDESVPDEGSETDSETGETSPEGTDESATEPSGAEGDATDTPEEGGGE